MTSRAFTSAAAAGLKATASDENNLIGNEVIVDSGSISITPVANTPTAGTVTFNFTFPSAPVVTLTPQTTVPGTTVTGVGVDPGTTTTTGCQIHLTRTNTTATVVNWLAVLTK